MSVDSRGGALLLVSVGAGAILLILALVGHLPWPVAILAMAALAGLALVVDRIGAQGERRPLAPSRLKEEGHAGRATFGVLAETLIDTLPEAIIVVDGDGRLVLANKIARVLFVGDNFARRQLAVVLRRPSIIEAVNRVRQEGSVEAIEFSDLGAVERHFSAYVAPISAGSVERGSVLLVIREVTAAKAVEQMRADFVANASHELRTPLASLTGFIETLRGHAKDDAGAREQFLAIMHDQAGRMGRLVDDLLSLSRIELNEHIPPSDTVDLKGVILDVVNGVEPLAQASKTRIETRFDPNLPPVLGARDELAQVIQNLLDNAIKYGGSDLPVEVVAGPGAPESVPGLAGPCCHVAVIDHGEGIAREHVPRLTERFYRVDVNRSRKRGGTGLGLAIVKHIVSRHRGRLHIKSEPGKGSCFTVLLPTDVAPQPNASPDGGP